MPPLRAVPRERHTILSLGLEVVWEMGILVLATLRQDSSNFPPRKAIIRPRPDRDAPRVGCSRFRNHRALSGLSDLPHKGEGAGFFTRFSSSDLCYSRGGCTGVVIPWFDSVFSYGLMSEELAGQHGNMLMLVRTKQDLERGVAWEGFLKKEDDVRPHFEQTSQSNIPWATRAPTSP